MGGSVVNGRDERGGGEEGAMAHGKDLRNENDCSTPPVHVGGNTQQDHP